jgi:hypothetical protein
MKALTKAILAIVIFHNDPTDIALIVHLGLAEAARDKVDGKLRLHKRILLVDMYHHQDEDQGQKTACVASAYPLNSLIFTTLTPPS